MKFISKGLPEKEGITPQLRVMSGGKIYTLFGPDETVWLRGRLDVAETASVEEEQTVQNLLRMGLAEYTSKEDPTARYTILTRCIIVPANPGKRVALEPTEKFILQWLRGAALRLSLAELVFLCENGVKPAKKYLGEENRQKLVERIYTAEPIDDRVLEARMEHAEKRDEVVTAVLGLLRKKRVVLL